MNLNTLPNFWVLRKMVSLCVEALKEDDCGMISSTVENYGNEFVIYEEDDNFIDVEIDRLEVTGLSSFSGKVTLKGNKYIVSFFGEDDALVGDVTDKETQKMAVWSRQVGETHNSVVVG